MKCQQSNANKTANTFMSHIHTLAVCSTWKFEALRWEICTYPFPDHAVKIKWHTGTCSKYKVSQEESTA